MKPPREQPALPGLPDGATQRPKRNRYAKSWMPDERQFADAMIDHWSAVFAGVVGGSRAHRTRHNRFVAIRFYRWNLEQPPDQRFNDEAVRQAIEGYRNDPTMRKMVESGRTHYKAFAAWFDDGVADAIDRQLTRLGLPRTQKGADARSAKIKRFAEDLLEDSGLGRAARLATTSSEALFDHLVWMQRTTRRVRTRNDKAAARFYDHLARLVERFKELDQVVAMDGYRTRGRAGFRAMTGRPPRKGSLEDANLIDALALALLDLDAKKGAVACA
ncbi:MAG: hypothetical protein ABII12_03315 [Planctomycetota bacterium]